MAGTQQQLDEARAALHRLNVGEAVRVFVDQNGERVEYVQASAGRLATYVEQLEEELGLPSRRGTPRPIRFVF